MATDFLDEQDEIWNWLARLTEITHVILVRTKSLSPNEHLQQDADKHTREAVRVLHVLSRDIALNPKGGGAVVEAFGIEDLIAATEKCLLTKKASLTPAALSKLLQVVKRYKTIIYLFVLTQNSVTEIGMRQKRPARE